MARGAYFQHDETTDASLSDNAYRVLGYLRHHVVKSEIVYPSIESMSEDLNRSVRTCKYAIAELKSAGKIAVFRDQKGRWSYQIVGAKTCTKKVQKTAQPEVQKPAQENAMFSAMYSATDSATHSAKFCTPPNNPLIGKATETTETNESSSSVPEESKPTPPATTTTTQNLEPFESGNPAPLPNVRNAVEPFRPRLVELRPTQFKPETRDRIMAVLGHDAEQFARKITQEQADAGFPDWILDEAKKNKTPARLAFHLLKTAWRPGWVSPKAEEEAKRAARRARLEALR